MYAIHGAVCKQVALVQPLFPFGKFTCESNTCGCLRMGKGYNSMRNKERFIKRGQSLNTGISAALGGFFLSATLAFGANAAGVDPNFDTFGNLTTLSGGEVTFGGDGIPTDPAAIRNIDLDGDGGTDVRLGIIATPRFASPAVTNDGAGTYHATPGTAGSPTGLVGSLWNFSFYAESTTTAIADLGLRLYYDMNPGADTPLSDLGIWDISATAAAFLPIGTTTFQTSQNLFFSFLQVDSPGIVAPDSAPFDPFAAGEYSFVLAADIDQPGVSINVKVVPVPAGLPLLLGAFAGLALLRRKRKS